MASLTLAAMLMAACAPSQSDAFGPVQRLALERTGHDVRWRSSDIDSEAHGARVRELLAQPLTLEGAVRVGLVNNAELQASFAMLGLGIAEVAEATLENPEVDAELRVPLNGTGSAVQLTGVQNLVSLVTLKGRRNAANAELKAARQRALGDVFDLIGKISMAFVDGQAAVEIETLRRTIRDSQAAQLELTTRLRDAGNVTALAVSQDQALLGDARLALAKAELATLTTRERINSLLGLSGRNIGWTIEGELAAVPADPIDVSELESQAVARSVALERERWHMKAAAARIGVARIESWLPRVGAGVTAEREFDGEWSVGPAITLAVPLWDQNNGARVRGRAQLRVAQHRYQAIAVMARAEARVVSSTLTQSRERVAFIENELLPARQKVLQETLKHYNAMNASPYALLDAKREEVAARVERIESLRDYWKTRASVETIQMGGTNTMMMGGE